MTANVGELLQTDADSAWIMSRTRLLRNTLFVL